MSLDGNNRRPIFLIGFMGCGKTTLGRAVSERLGCTFADLDAVIETRVGMTVSRYFDTFGEESFRKLESETLQSIVDNLSLNPAIIACGGGTPCHGDNLKLMRKVGTVVFLDASVDRIVARLLEADGQRPLVAGLDGLQTRDYVERTLRQRMPFYACADSSFSGDRLDNEAELKDSVDKFIKQYFQRQG